MKRLLLLTITLLLPLLLWAQEGAEQRVEDTLQQIFEEQGVDTLEEVRPERVSPDRLAQLGEAVMELSVADDGEREWMEEMMGGSGSQQLRSMYRWMGYNYLRNGGNLTLGAWGPGGFGPGMAGPGVGPGSMHGWSQGSWQTPPWQGDPTDPRLRSSVSPRPWIWVIGVLLVLVIVILAAVLMRTGGHRSREGETRSPDDWEEILRQRYARGEISRDEYHRMKEDME